MPNINFDLIEEIEFSRKMQEEFDKYTEFTKKYTKKYEYIFPKY